MVLGAPPWGLGRGVLTGLIVPSRAPGGSGRGVVTGVSPPTRGSRLQLPAPAQKIGFGGSGRGVVTGLVVPSRARNIGFPLIDANCWGSGRGVVTGLIVPSPLSNIVKPYQQHATCTCFAASRKGSAKRHLPLRLHSSHSNGPTPRLLCFLSAALSNCRAPHKRPHAAPVQRYSSASCAVQPFRPQSLHTAAPLVFKCFFQIFVSKQNTTTFLLSSSAFPPACA